MERIDEEANARILTRWLLAGWVGWSAARPSGLPTAKMAARAAWSKAARRKSQRGATRGDRGPVAGRTHRNRNRLNPRPVRRLGHWPGRPWHPFCWGSVIGEPSGTRSIGSVLRMRAETGGIKRAGLLSTLLLSALSLLALLRRAA